MNLMLGDCLEKLSELPDNSVDSVVTDPPYGLSFMGKKWDYEVPSVAVWKEVLRVLKPGGHLLSFAGTRTYHRMAVNIEDAGFEIRDQIMWIYGQGFPKSLDISKALDKMAGAEREVLGTGASGIAQGSDKRNFAQGKRSREYDAKTEYEITAPATEAAKLWDGWGTALKPANEPICLARKPISEKNIAANVLKWGVGGINVDGCRISSADPIASHHGTGGGAGRTTGSFNENYVPGDAGKFIQTQGRFPANVLFDEEAAAVLGEPSRFFYCAKVSARERNAGLEGMPKVKLQDYAEGTKRKLVAQAEGPKNPNLPRANFHPTVKPVKLMEYLCRLITPTGGVVLDPFMGSGSTGIAAKNLGFQFIGIEREPEYHAIATQRISAAVQAA